MKYLPILFCIVGFSAIAQTPDSLLRVISKMPEDTHLVMAYRALFNAYYDQDQHPEMLSIAQKGLDLSRKIHFVKGIDLFLFYKGTTLDIMGKGTEAVPVFLEGLQLAQTMGEKKNVANYHASIGNAWYAMGEEEKALEQYLAAYEMYKVLDLQKNLSKMLNNIGIIYRRQHKHDRAEQIYKESLAIKEALKDTLGMAASYQNLAAVLSISEREKEMIDYLQRALNIYEKRNRMNDAAGCYALLGQIHFNLNRPREAREVLLKAKAYFDLKPSAEYSSNVYQLLGNVATLEKEYPQAESYLLESQHWARKFGLRERVWDICNELSKVQHLMGKHAAAYASLRTAFALRDSITEMNRLSLMAEMQTKFDVVQKDNQLKVNQLDLNKRTAERNGFMLGAALLALLSLVIFMGFKNRIRANKKIAAQASELQQQQILQLEQASKLSTLHAMLAGEEKERNRIASDLHDGLGGLLTSVKSHFNALKIPPEHDNLFDKTNRLIDDACVEVRRISHNMMPRALHIAGLKGALEDLAGGLEKQGVTCQLEIIGLDQEPEPEKAVMVLRIIQELLNNAVKHAGGDRILLQLIQHEQILNLLVEDNGKGFQMEHAQAKKGLGLFNIASRVEYLQGHITWDSVPGEGTTVQISIPV